MRRLSVAQAHHAVDVLCNAFHDYPVMRYVIGPVGGDYDRRLRTPVNFFVMARVWRDDPILGVSNGSELIAVATLTLPGKRPLRLPNFAKPCGASWAMLHVCVMRHLDRQRRSLI